MTNLESSKNSLKMSVTSLDGYISERYHLKYSETLIFNLSKLMELREW